LVHRGRPDRTPGRLDPVIQPNRQPGRAPWADALALVAAVFAVGIALELFTRFVWEDFLITFRFSENLAAGKGFVYREGQRVFGFTSPLNGFLPAIFKRVLGGEGFERSLWAFALVSLGVLAAGLVAHASLLRENPSGGASARTETALVAAFCILNTKLMVFTMSGQEAGLWAGFLLLGFAALVRGAAANWLALGLAWGGLMWTRPDGVVQIGLMAVAAVALDKDHRGSALAAAKALLVCAAVYSPWAVGTWLYYGSPVPHTIIAKNGMFGHVDLPAKALKTLAALRDSVPGPFEGIYSAAGGWPAWVHWLAAALGVVCSGAWLIPRADRILRTASFLFLGCALYLGFVQASGMIFPWYYAPGCTFGAVVLARAAALGLGAASRLRPASVVLATAAIGLAAYVGTFSAIQLRIRQKVVEVGVRTALGKWLHGHAAPDDRVFLEPIGYIGYYSRIHILDYPGLITPEVVEARRKTRGGFYECAELLRPEWLVLRLYEIPVLASFGDLSRDYQPMVVFDGAPVLKDYLQLPGWGFLISDSRMIVLKRRIQPPR
jgi:hypothetical protein